MDLTKLDLDKLGEDVAGEQDHALREDDSLAEAEARLFAPKKAPSRRSPWWAFAAAALLVGLAGLWFTRARPLSFDVAGRAGQIAQWIPADREVPVRFSDGSSMVLRAGARARVQATTSDGASVTLERGQATIAVVHRERTAWRVAAGPYDVLVTGTRFDLSWTPEREHFRLAMVEGSVEVRGPSIEGTRVLVAGQTLELAPAPPARPDPSASAAPLPPTATPSAEPAPTSTASAPPPEASPDWRKLAAAGEYRAAYEAMEPALAGLLASGSAQDLVTVADVARYAGKGARAGQAYRALRSRHAGTPQAARAAFALGMMSFGGNKAAAATWFETYLQEAPGGALAREALGRILEVRRSPATARQYLAAYPKGPHAELARSLLGGAP